MIKYHKGDLIQQVKRGNIIHGQNYQGKSGAGIAKQIMLTYPEAIEVYNKHIDVCKKQLGLSFDQVKGSYSSAQVTDDLKIYNVLTQNFYGYAKVHCSYSAIQQFFLQIGNITGSIHMPKIGCGHAGGDWNIVERIILETVPTETTINVWDF